MQLIFFENFYNVAYGLELIRYEFVRKFTESAKLGDFLNDKEVKDVLRRINFSRDLRPNLILSYTNRQPLSSSTNFLLGLNRSDENCSRKFTLKCGTLQIFIFRATACDLVAFHIEDYCLNFLDCCHRQLGCKVDCKNLLVDHEGRRVAVRALPIGIPFDRFVQMAQEAPRVVQDPHQRIILGVDRLDYTKGLVHRLRAFELLLEKYPQYIEDVIFLQIAVPSRTDVKEYQDLKEDMDQMVGRINGRFSTPNWSPIRYIYGCLSQVILITSTN